MQSSSPEIPFRWDFRNFCNLTIIIIFNINVIGILYEKINSSSFFLQRVCRSSVLEVEVELEVDIVIGFNHLLWSYIFLPFHLLSSLFYFIFYVLRQIKWSRNFLQMGSTRFRIPVWSLTSRNFFRSNKIYRFNISNLQRKYYEKY